MSFDRKASWQIGNEYLEMEWVARSCIRLGICALVPSRRVSKACISCLVGLWEQPFMLLLRRKGTDCVRASPDLSGSCPSTAKLTWWWSCLHILYEAQRQPQQEGAGGGGGGGRGACRVPFATTAVDQNSNNTSGDEIDVVFVMHD